jgi:hypothetical protein
LEATASLQDLTAVPNNASTASNFPVPCEIINPLVQQQQQQQQQQPTHSNQTGQYDTAGNYNYMQFFPLQQQMPVQNPVLYQQYQLYQQQTQQQQFAAPSPYPQASPSAVKSPQEEVSNDQSKTKSLERSAGQSLVAAYAARINSLERTRQIGMDYGSVKGLRSNSLTRQFSGGNAGDFHAPHSMRSASLERGGHVNQMANRMGSLERNQNQQQLLLNAMKGGSLERNQTTAILNDMMANRGFRGGSLERNQAIIMQQNRGGSLERNIPYQYRPMQGVPRDQPHQEPFQEEIYDFGGVNVKSCASIALKKSVEKGILPPSVLNPPAGQMPPNYALPPPYSSAAQTSKYNVQGTPQRQMWNQQANLVPMTAAKPPQQPAQVDTTFMPSV